MTPKKRGRPATGTDPHLSFRSPPAVTRALGRAAKAVTDAPSRSEMIRRIVTQWLEERGHLGEE
ncbi:MAG: hypothetical protein ACFE0R_15650 [Salinarimonas sp.]